jgi:hypothetical protein
VLLAWTVRRGTGEGGGLLRAFDYFRIVVTLLAPILLGKNLTNKRFDAGTEFSFICEHFRKLLTFDCCKRTSLAHLCDLNCYFINAAD